MTEREVVTLALGNYASLVAAQWANGTTVYDRAHNTLYTERRRCAVRGSVMNDQQNQMMMSSDFVRVPRLVLLDAPHSTRLKRTRHVVSDNACQDVGSEHEVDDVDENSDGCGLEEERIGKNIYTRSAAERSGAASTGEQHFNNIAYDEESSGQQDATPPLFRDPEATKTSSFSERQSSFRKIKKELFCEEDSLVPWWQYIHGGVCEDSLHVLHPLHRIAATSAGINEVPLLHNFGFGVTHLRSSVSGDVADVMNSIRRQLEDADSLQGLQCFVDSGSAFGGAACNIMEELWEDAGPKTPVTFFSCFQPLPEEILAQHSDVDFADRRRDEACLNRLLATTSLSRHDSSVYIPLELKQWHDSFAAALATDANSVAALSWLQNDVATAQLIATVADSALYGTRDKGFLDSSSEHGPAFYMQDWQATIRPIKHLRVAAALVSIPMWVHDARCPRGDLWEFLERHPLLQTRPESNGGCFVPLTHTLTHGPQTDAGRVLGHAVTLRGAGQLSDLTYPRQEALLRYALPLRSGNYLPLVTENSYPISSTFPHDFVLPKELLLSGALQGIDAGSHIVSTYDSVSMLKSIADESQKILRHRRHLHESSYGMDYDEWKEALEEVLGMRDDYHHPGDEDYGGDGDDD
uniref:Tubulin/FtsZ GTPase domain-containing protein n=1 Tax=Trypanosoma congolense (strain IL3000) TaxID=1068625 RepID=G0UIX3_TRYCI|nr:conserved hypothetical protein [Trypanosoma congolense IL3000]